MNNEKMFDLIKKEPSNSKKQLLMVSYVTKILEEKKKPSPIVVGGCALSYT